MIHTLPIVVIGGGAAGFFGAITCKQANPSKRVILLEKTEQLLAKVRISGGGRCNVTHSCFDPALLIKNYPRGGKELLGPFHRFQVRDTIDWFQARGVELKTEPDGRMFPVTDSSETIINCLMQEAKDVGVEILTGVGVEGLGLQKNASGFSLTLSQKEPQKAPLECAKILIATGSNRKIMSLVEALGHTIEPLVPSLFTFNVPTSPLLELSGIAVESAHLSIEGTQLEQTGPLLVTHWGFSGPAVLKLSAWGAKELFAADYKAKLLINWLPKMSLTEIQKTLQKARDDGPTKQITVTCPVLLPKNLWKKFCALCSINDEMRYQALSNKLIGQLADKLHRDAYQIDGKTTYKQEFVTCGGTKLSEVNFKTMESKLVPGLYFAGEVLNIDGITGGFNFQNAWTTGYIAGQSLAE